MKEKRLLPPATMATLYYGFPARFQQPTLDPKVWTIKNHGEPSTCVALAEPRYMI